VDRILDRVANAILLALAAAFVAAVALNFANVIGRYVFGRSIPGADEVQIYVMVFMAFLGAAVVSWRQAHLRMDVLVRGLPGRAQWLLKAAEALLLVVLTGFVCLQSARYTLTMFELGRRSDDAGIPMWIPHGAVALGFGLIAMIALRRVGSAVLRRTSAPAAAAPPASARP
jgi:C4-dicarboxylate transporter DctQ subunit